MDQKKINHNTFFNRRDFVKKSLQGIGAIAIGSYTLTSLSSCSDSSSPTSAANNNTGGSLEVDISRTENQALATVGGTLALNSNTIDSSGLLLHRVSNTLINVFSRNCTHQGCTVGAFQSGVSTCPCHNSEFNLSGAPISGPASASLTQYNATLDGNILTITR